MFFVILELQNKHILQPISEVLGSKLIFLLDACLFLGREVVLHLEELADFLSGLALDEGGEFGGTELQQGLDIKVVSGDEQIKEESLVYILRDIIVVPLADVLRQVV